MAGVRLCNLTKRFGKVTAVNQLDLEVRDKEFLVLVGPSGCGKTTALRMVAGLEEATEGEIYIADRLVNDVSPKDRDIAMVFQNYALYPHMSVYDNMAFGLRLRRSNQRALLWRRAAFTRKEIDQRVQGAASMLGLSELLHRKPKELSGGQRQRVALGRAIVREPKVFLMDEPLSNLDAKLRVQTRAELIKLHRRLGITTIYVTHDQMEAMTMGDRIAVLKDGLLQQVDAPLNLYNHPANLFVAGFIGSPAMNFMEATVEQQAGGTFVNTGDFALLLPEDKTALAKEHVGKQAIFGIRPVDLYDQALASPVPASEHNTVRMSVDVTEPMGATVYAYLTIGKHTLIAELDAATGAKIGGSLDVVFHMERAHLFDQDSELALF